MCILYSTDHTQVTYISHRIPDPRLDRRDIQYIAVRWTDHTSHHTAHAV